MGRYIGAVASGLLFGAGLVVAGMVDPLKVLGFLDVTGDWDPTLAFVMGGALLVSAPAYWFARRGRGKPWAAASFQWPTSTDIDRRLLVGAGLFGVGWGLVGYCPGPALAGLGAMWRELVWFLPAFAAGSWLAGRRRFS